MFIPLIFFFSLSLLLPNQIQAIVPSSTPTLVISETITPTSPTTLDEIQKIREAVQQKVQQKLKEITSSSSPKKGFIGKVILVDNSQITIEYQNDTRSIKIDADTLYIDIKRNKTKLSAVTVGQDILALGIVDDSGIMLAKRIVFSDLKSLQTPRVVVVGKVIDVSKSASVFSLIPIKNKNSQYQIKTDPKTIFTDSKGQKIASNTLVAGQKIITILTPDTKLSKTYYATRIINLDYTPSPTPTKK
ncbi:hypothetical protein KBC75_05600 [Candidatus Shapirobacteria bacterium]|nr:hypothetical protein [Candidatus Shapirobacteria bacterium]